MHPAAVPRPVRVAPRSSQHPPGCVDVRGTAARVTVAPVGGMSNQNVTEARLEPDRLAALVDIGRDFCSSLDIEDVLSVVIDRVISMLRAERGFLVLVDERNGGLLVKVARNINASTIDEENFMISRGIINKVAEEKEPILSSDATTDPRFDTFGSVALHSIRSIMCVPLIFKERLVGLLYVDNRIQTGVFQPRDLRLLTAIGQQAAVAIENARHYERIKNIVVALANAIEAKDQYTGGHVDRVAMMAVEIGREMGLRGEALYELEMTSILHDVGKIGIDDRILRKPGMLDAEERDIMEQHPSIGASIIEPIPIAEDVKRSVRYHQERWDGKGYPERLAGESIPLYARITAVADAWDTITSNRPYRNGRPGDIAIREITRCSGTQFDPAVVTAFLRVVDRIDIEQYTEAGAQRSRDETGARLPQ